MRKLAASVAALLVLFALCGSAWGIEEQEPNQPFDQRQEFAVTEYPTQVSGDIVGALDGDPADYFRFTGLDSSAYYEADITTFYLALLVLDDQTGAVEDVVYGAGVPLENLHPTVDGNLSLAVCALDSEEPPGTYDCTNGVRPIDPSVGEYVLTLAAPEPAATTLHLAALLCLAVLSRRRA